MYFLLFFLYIFFNLLCLFTFMTHCTCVYKINLHDPSCVIDLFVYKEVSAALNIFGKSDEPSSRLKTHGS